MNWEFLIASIALAASIFSIGFTVYRTRKTEGEKKDEYRYRLITRVQSILIDAEKIKKDNSDILQKLNNPMNENEKNLINASKDVLSGVNKINDKFTAMYDNLRNKETYKHLSDLQEVDHLLSGFEKIFSRTMESHESNMQNFKNL